MSLVARAAVLAMGLSEVRVAKGGITLEGEIDSRDGNDHRTPESATEHVARTRRHVKAADKARARPRSR